MKPLTDYKLAERLEAFEAQMGFECVRAARRLHPRLVPQAIKVAGGFACFAGAYSPLTHALGLGFDGPVVESEIEELEAFYAEHRAQTCIEVCPLADPSLIAILARRGYQIREFQNTLVRAIDSEEELPLLDPAFEVRRMGDEEVGAWGRVVVQGFTGEASLSQDDREIFEPIFFQAFAQCYLIFLAGEPVGGGALVVREEMAYITSTSTLSAYRGRGVHTALMAAFLAMAKAQGCNLAAIGTLPGTVSERNAERLGFFPAFTKVVLVRALDS